MAITIRNKETEAMIRRVWARAAAKGPSAVVIALAEAEVRKQDGQASQTSTSGTDGGVGRAAWQLAPPRDPSLTWAEIEAEMQDHLDD